MKHITTFLFSLALSLNVVAGGFQVNLQGNRSAGMGHTGTGLRLGAASGFFNPGALAFSRSEVLIGINLISAYVGYREFEPGIYQAQKTDDIGTPFHGYAAFKLSDDSPFVFGLGVYTPFGSSIAYDDDWKGQFLLREMGLRAIFYQGTIAYQVNERLGIGLGYVFGTGDFVLRRAVPLQLNNGEYGEANLSGAGIGHGFNVGVFYDIAENISIGASYRSGIGVSLEEGKARFDVPPALSANFPETNFTTQLNLPSVLNLGLGIKATEKLTLALDMNYVAWSSYDTLSFDFEQNTDNLEDVNSPRQYRNVVILRLGAEYELNDKLTLRAGTYYDFTPVQDGFMTPETPDMDKIGVSIGASYTYNKLTVDASFLFVTPGERSDTNLETQFAGVWSSRAFIPGVSFSYKF